MSKSKIVYSVLIVLCIIFTVNLCKSDGLFNNTRKVRQDMAPAKTADEWLDRLQKDLGESSYQGVSLPKLYAELPALDQWAAISAKLNEISKDDASFETFTNSDDRHRFGQEGDNRLKVQLFSALLAEDGTDTEPLYRSLLLNQKSNGSLHSYYSNDNLTKLLLLSKDPDESIAWFRKHIQKEKNNSHSHSESNKSAWKKALAENRINEGIQLLLSAIKNAKVDDRGELISKLARIAQLLDKPELGKQALKMLENDIISRKKADSHFSIYDYSSGLEYYAHLGEWQRLHDICEKTAKTKTNTDSDSYYTSSSSSHDSLLPYQLTALFNLKKFDAFEKGLRSEIKKNHDSSNEIFSLLEERVADSPSLGALYIDLLTDKGDDASKKLAYKICTHLLARNQGKDGYYKRAIDLAPEAAATFIASLRKYDPFEERPLIWQAEMALQAGELDKADTLIQQAIALDPSDGDHGKFSRMLCYDVYSRILAKQGHAEKAKLFKEVMIAIREGEVADDYLYAGLTQEATERYRKALGHFNDAYCLQSRLAKTLMEAGKFEEAIPHFKKAFELMPVSFGPRESHCFGCEGLFDDERVQNIALPTLNAFLEKEPANPRTPYLLGLLFEEMKKEPEAIAAYQKAIELDPHYYNAARNLYKLIVKDPKNFKQAISLKKQLYEISSYERKPSYMASPHLLKSYWKLAQEFPPSPIKLDALDELNLTTPKLSDQQFKKLPANQSHVFWSSSYNREAALDGWSTRELLLRNSFLKEGF